MEPGESVVRDVWEQWNSGDRDVRNQLVHSELEVYSALTKRVYRGRDEVRQWIGEIDDQFDDWNLSIDEVSTIAPGRLLVIGGIHGRGRQSGVDLDEPSAWIIEIRDGLLAGIRNYIGREAVERAKAEASARPTDSPRTSP